jgi:hypothetical protein
MTRRRPTVACRTYGALALVALIGLAGCTPTGSSPSSSGAASPSALASASLEPSIAASQAASVQPTSSATAAPSEPESSLPFACSPSVTIARTTTRAQITDVRVAAHTGYDRVVFQFASGIPQTVIEGVLPPFYKDPSGLPLDVAGAAFLKVTMNGASKVTPAGGITYTGPTSFKPGFDQLKQLVESGDSEAVSTWYLGLDPGGCIRVLTLAAPSRLVIDVKH